MASFFAFPFLLSCITLSVLIQIPSCLSTEDYYTSCASRYDCGNIRNIGFPFQWKGRPNGCGHPELYLDCRVNSAFLTIKSVEYKVLEAKPDDNVLKIARFDYAENLCPERFLNTSLDPQVFEFLPSYKNLTLLYGCPATVPKVDGRFRCPKNELFDENGYAQLGVPDPSVSCYTSVVVPVSATLLDTGHDIKVQDALRDGFEVKCIAGLAECYECQESGGVCGFDLSSNQATCYCKGQSSDSKSKTCPSIIGDETPRGPSGTFIS